MAERMERARWRLEAQRPALSLDQSQRQVASPRIRRLRSYRKGNHTVLSALAMKHNRFVAHILGLDRQRLRDAAPGVEHQYDEGFELRVIVRCDEQAGLSRRETRHDLEW